MHESEYRGKLLLNGKPMSEEVLARVLGCDKQILSKTLDCLLDHGVASRDEQGALVNRRMVRDEKLRRVRAKAGKKGAESRLLKQNAKQTPSKPQANAKQTGKQKGGSSSSSSSSSSDKNSQQERPVERGRSPAKRGARIPPDFCPRSEDVAWAKKNHPSIDLDYETGKFRDYWTAKPGKDGVKLDWTATWRNWIRKADEYGSKSSTNGRKLTPAEQYARYGYEE